MVYDIWDAHTALGGTETEPDPAEGPERGGITRCRVRWTSREGSQVILLLLYLRGSRFPPLRSYVGVVVCRTREVVVPLPSDRARRRSLEVVVPLPSVSANAIPYLDRSGCHPCSSSTVSRETTGTGRRFPDVLCLV